MLIQFPGLFEAWNNVTGSLLPLDSFWGLLASIGLALVLLLLTAASAFAELWFMTKLLSALGSFWHDVVLLGVFSVTTPLLVALGFAAMFAPNVHSLVDLLGYWALAACWIVPVLLLSEAVIVYLLLGQRRSSVRIQV